MLQTKMKFPKSSGQGKMISVQPRIPMAPSFDQRSHSYLGYSLCRWGRIDHHEGEFLIGIGRET